MLAAVLHETNTPLRLEEVELTPPGPGEVAVRVHASGVCHSDWNAVTGATPGPLPVVLGHEGAGIVEEVGDGVRAVAPGDRVVLSWMPACGRCFYCRRGRPNLCDAAVEALFAGTLLGGETRLSQRGRPIHHYSFLSTFAERAIVPEASCVPIRADVPLSVAAIVGCAVMTGVGAVVNRARLEPGSVALVYGTGGVGLSVVLGCRLAGAAAVVVAEPVEWKRRLAVELGASQAVPAADDAAALARERTQGRGADYAFVAAGVPSLFTDAYAATRRAGTVVCIGLPPEQAQASFPASGLVREEKVVTGSLYGSCRDREDMPRLLDLFVDGRLPLDRLVTRTYPLERINEAFDDMNAGRVARGVLDLTGDGR